MSDELSPAERMAHEDEDDFIPRDLAAGVSEDEIVAKLVRLDWSPNAARAYIHQFQQEDQLWRGTPEDRQILVATYFRQMLAGVALIVFSVVACTMFLALGVLVFIFIGLFLLGLFWTFNGLSKCMRFRHKPHEDVLES